LYVILSFFLPTIIRVIKKLPTPSNLPKGKAKLISQQTKSVNNRKTGKTASRYQLSQPSSFNHRKQRDLIHIRDSDQNEMKQVFYKQSLQNKQGEHFSGKLKPTRSKINNSQKLKIAAYNCKNVKTSVPAINK
jgi:hypothetical protein